MNPSRSVPHVMLLIDADNVTVDVIEQALHLVLERHGAAHVRRAYCTAELAVKQMKLFKAHSIRPMVNVSTGKNSTDIALAVDAMDLVVSERPDVVVLVSSDSDFAPLVIRLREKGCRVEGIGQEGKTGDDSKPVYDGFIDLAHRRASTTATASSTTVVKTASRKASSKRAPAPSRNARSRGSVNQAKAGSSRAAPVSDAGDAPPSPPAPAPSPAPRAAGRPAAANPAEVERMLAALPELQDGVRMQLNQAKERLLAAGLLAKSAPSTKLFRKYPTLFVLTPEKTPNKVQYLQPDER